MSVKSLFAPKRPEPSYPPLPQVRQSGESTVPGLYLIGEVGGTPLIKLGLNQGVELVERLHPELQTTAQSDAGPLDLHRRLPDGRTFVPSATVAGSRLAPRLR